jgi:tyrosine aminotransferase
MDYISRQVRDYAIFLPKNEKKENYPLTQQLMNYVFVENSSISSTTRRFSKYGSLKEIKLGAKRLSQLVLGASHLIQAVVPKLVTPTNEESKECIQEWKQNLRRLLSEQASYLCNALHNVSGLSIPTKPSGAMYAMVQIDIDAFDDTITNDIDFTKQLYEEERVFVLPGSCFSPPVISNIDTADSSNGVEMIPKNEYTGGGGTYYFRVVFCAPVDILSEAATRIQNFCTRHKKL